MSLIIWNVVLALIWAATTEGFGAVNLTIGMVIGFLLLYGTRRVLGSGEYFRNLREVVELVWFFIRELVLSNFRMAYYTLMPLDRMRPGVIAVSLDPMSEVELAVLSNLITLTPGTLSLDASEDRRTLYVHVMWFRDPEEVRAEIKRGFEMKVLKGLRSEEHG